MTPECGEFGQTNSDSRVALRGLVGIRGCAVQIYQKAVRFMSKITAIDRYPWIGVVLRAV
jgi:hypothetical protein